MVSDGDDHEQRIEGEGDDREQRTDGDGREQQTGEDDPGQQTDGGDRDQQMDREEAERGIYHRQIDPSPRRANEELIGITAELEGCDVEDLPSFWTRVDDLVTDLFSDPPAPEARARLEFTYAGCRIDVDQTGEVELVKVAGG